MTERGSQQLLGRNQSSVLGDTYKSEGPHPNPVPVAPINIPKLGLMRFYLPFSQQIPD